MDSKIRQQSPEATQNLSSLREQLLHAEAKASVALDGETQVVESSWRTPDSCAIVSGGLDSTTLVYDMLDHGYSPHMLSFNYGQRHRRELDFAALTARRLNLRHNIIDLSGITHLISNSALTSRPSYELDESHVEIESTAKREIEVPEGHYAEDTMKATVVPNRNMIMLAIAGGIAVSNKYKTIGIGVHGGDHFIYPDCRPEFIFSVGQALLQGNEGFHNFETLIDDLPEQARAMGYTRMAKPILTPYLDKTKADIAVTALRLGVPLDETWSCYKGDKIHCGRCGTCVERLEAIDQAAHRRGLTAAQVDKTAYADIEFWKEATKDA